MLLLLLDIYTQIQASCVKVTLLVFFCRFLNLLMHFDPKQNIVVIIIFIHSLVGQQGDSR